MQKKNRTSAQVIVDFQKQLNYRFNREGVANTAY